MIDVNSGDVIDRNRLVDGTLVHETGAAKGFFATKRGISGASDEQLFTAYADWSNGYLQLVPADGPAGPETTEV